MHKYVNGKVMKQNELNLLDQYFTKHEEAERLYSIAKKTILKYEKSLDKYTWIEPSSGEGCFLDLLPKDKRIGIDIDPKRNDVIKSNYLSYQLPNKPIVIIGNPPFGNRGVIALDFINHSQGAEYVCFILPMFYESVGKGSIKYRVKGFNLIKSVPVEKNSFYIPETQFSSKKDIDVKCCFQIWSKNHKVNKREFSWYNNNKPFSDIVDIVTVSTAKKRECGKKWIFEKKADFYISSTFFKSNKVVESFDKVKYSSGLAIIITTKDKLLKQKIKTVLKNADWNKYSSLATNSCRHIGMSHIYQLLLDNGIKEKAIKNERKI